jgi:16S rRNA (uracil1498-N3)-methyltransferase
MTQRYFLSAPVVDDLATLAGEEAHHLIHVMRARPGDVVTLFDGSGLEYQAEVRDLLRSTARLVVRRRKAVDRELPRPVTLAVALPKGDRQRWLVEKLVELGVARLIPLQTARGVAQGVEGALARLERAVIEASKQCGRNVLMKIESPVRCTDLFAASAIAKTTRWLAHPGGQPLAEQLDKLSASVSAASPGDFEFIAAVGPEGGFTDEESQAAIRCDWQPIDLGPRILRMETAALVLATLAATQVSRGRWRSGDT